MYVYHYLYIHVCMEVYHYHYRDISLLYEISLKKVRLALVSSNSRVFAQLHADTHIHTSGLGYSNNDISLYIHPQAAVGRRNCTPGIFFLKF